MANKKDRLTMDVIEAHKVGMSYGMWKVMHPHTNYDEEIPEPEYMPDIRCPVCGMLVPKPRFKFCSDECSNIYRKERAYERYLARKAKKAEEIV